MPSRPHCVLAVIPHPDDESYAMAGALHAAAQAGARVHVLCATRGERGDDFSARPGHTVRPSDLAARRSRELAASCAGLGVSPPRFLDLPDGGLTDLPPGRLEATLVDALQELAPQVVLSLGPDGAYAHADHLALTDALKQALAWAPGSPRALWAAFPRALFEPQWRRLTGGADAALVPGAAPRLGVDAHAVDLKLLVEATIKRASIEAHRSQLPDGRAESLFPPGIVATLLREEWYQLASGPRLPDGPAPPESAGGLLAGAS